MKIIKFLPLIVLLLSPQSAKARAPLAAPRYQTPADLIAEVNALRATYGLPPLNNDGILMSVAQAHTDYQASIQTVTHTGANGSRPRDRAAAAGYGGGGTFFISENIIGGTGMTPAAAVQWWTGDLPHLNTMIGPNYTHIGAGVAADANGRTYYTIDVAYIASAPGNNPTPIGYVDPWAGSGAGSGGASPVIVATPLADGSIIHVVQPGQALYTIAVVYDVALETILALNKLTENSFIFPGDKILIKTANTPTPPPAPSDTPIPSGTPVTPTRTPRPFETPTPLGGDIAQPASPGVAETAGSSPAPGVLRSLAVPLLIILALAAGALVLVGNLREQ